jgi:hypothetical protein
MKKIFFSFLAIAAIASCAKTEAVYEGADSEIKLAPVAAKQTKANVLGAIDGTEYPTAENFDVYGYWKNVGAGETYTDGQSYFGGAVEFTNKGNYWGGVTPYYWPKNGALRFAAYSPADLDLAHEQVGDVFSVDTYVQPSNTAETWDFLVAPTSESYTAMTAAENVSVVFEHALSWITLQVKTKDAAAEGVFTIKSVKINGVNTTADFEASMLDQEMVQYESWTNWGAPAEYVVFDGVQGVTAEPTVIENTAAGTLVIPQATTNVTVVFDQKGVNGTMDMTDMVVNLDLVLDQDNKPWRPGYHYTYTLIFGLDEILINPSVDTWEEYIWAEGGSQGNIDTDKEIANVATEAQLAAALAKGGKVVLQNNIEVTSTLNVEKTVVLELNGFTLKNNVNNANTDVIVVAENGELTINGDGTIEAVTGNDGYTVISEGLLIINGGTYKSGVDANGEPNAVIYARGNGKVFVNGGEFPNENGSKFVLNKKDSARATTEISVAGGKFQNFDPANNLAEGEGTNFMKDGFTTVEQDGWFVVARGAANINDFTTAINEAAAVNVNAPINNGSNVININDNDVVINMDGQKITAGGQGTNNYAFNVYGSEVEINDANIDGAGFAVLDDSNVTINNGTIAAKPGKSGRNMFYVAGNSTVTINEGTYTFDRQKNYFVYVEAGSTCYINGGHYEKPLANNATSDSFVNNGSKGTVVITGGTFNMDPTKWLAEGYKAVKNGKFWTVSAE